MQHDCWSCDMDTLIPMLVRHNGNTYVTCQCPVCGARHGSDILLSALVAEAANVPELIVDPEGE